VIGEVAVVVPAADEQDGLPACLGALAAARAHLAQFRPDVLVRVVVVLDNCTDRSEEVVRAYREVEVETVSLGRVGAVRAAGTERVLGGVTRTVGRQLWLANTDADSTVPPDWLCGMVAAGERGAHVVLGTVVPGPGLPAAARRRWDAGHVAGEGHRHVHGANFGIRADTYRSLGGWPDLRSGEDEALAARAAADPRVRVLRTATLPVLTSTRLVGRAPCGFSSYLRGLTAASEPADERSACQTPSAGTSTQIGSERADLPAATSASHYCLGSD